MLTTDQLQDLAASTEPIDPFVKQGNRLQNISFRQTLEKALKRRETREKWAETRKAIALMAGAAVQSELQVDRARIQTNSVFNPVLIDSVPVRSKNSAKFRFNLKKEQLIVMEDGEGVTHPTTLYLKTGTQVPDHELEGYNDMIVRKNGEVWIAGSVADKIVVKKFPGDDVHFSIDAADSVLWALYETPTGRLFLSISFARRGLLVLDVTDKNKVAELMNDPRPTFKVPVFYVGKKGVLMATAKDDLTEVYRYSSGQMMSLGEIHGSRDKARTVSLTADANGNPIVGEPIENDNGYQVTKLVDQEPETIFREANLKVNGHGAILQWNRMGELILAIPGTHNSPGFYLINLSEKSFPRITMKTPPVGKARPSWYKLPDGNEVIALALFDVEAIIFHADDGTILQRFKATGGLNTGPQWAKFPDGRIYLALDGKSEVQVYSVWQTEPSAAAK